MYGKADVMNIRRFSALALIAATLALCARFAAPAIAQESSTPKAAPDAATIAAEPVQLSAGGEDVLKLSRAKVSDDVIVAFIQSSGQRFNLTAAEIVHLRKEGVSDR